VTTVFLHSCRFLYYPPLDTNETALHCQEGRFFSLLHEKRGLLGSLSGDTKGGQHWRKTVCTAADTSGTVGPIPTIYPHRSLFCVFHGVAGTYRVTSVRGWAPAIFMRFAHGGTAERADAHAAHP